MRPPKRTWCGRSPCLASCRCSPPRSGNGSTGSTPERAFTWRRTSPMKRRRHGSSARRKAPGRPGSPSPPITSPPQILAFRIRSTPANLCPREVIAIKSTDPRIDAYIGKTAGFAKPILTHLRKMVREACPEAEETTKWSMPSFVYRGKILCGKAAFKKHCAFWFWHRGMSAVLGADGRKSDAAMGSFGRLKSLDDLPSDKKMALYIRKAAVLNESDAPARPKLPI